VRGEAAVGQAQHPWLQRRDEFLGQGDFPDRVGVHSRGDDRVRAALAERDNPHLWEGAAVAAPGPGPTEHAGVGVGVVSVSATSMVVPSMLTSRQPR
jgi:hypothetical protein